MAIHDYVIDNQSASAFRSDLNGALQAIVTQNSNATAPTTTYANMIWYDTANNQLKKRNEANSAWIILGTIDETLGTFNTSGTPAIATQAEAQAGTDNTKMMTPLRTAEAIAASAQAYSNLQLFTASGTFTTPAGVTQALVFVMGGGGGGGGGGSASAVGGNGGSGGLTCQILSVSGSLAVTVGAGGTGGASPNGNGTAGGTSSFSTLSATGGAGGISGGGGGAAGASGVGSGGTMNTNVSSIGYGPALAIPVTVTHAAALAQSGVSSAPTSSPVSYSLAAVGRAGSIGAGGGVGLTGRGGSAGAVFIFY